MVVIPDSTLHHVDIVLAPECFLNFSKVIVEPCKRIDAYSEFLGQIVVSRFNPSLHQGPCAVMFGSFELKCRALLYVKVK